MTEAKQVTSVASSLLFPGIEIGVASNATFTREDSDPVLSRIAFENEFANAGAKAYQTAVGDDVAIETTTGNPLARALLYYLRAFDADGIELVVDAVRETILTHAARTRVFETPVAVAIDIHDWLFYGAEDTSKVANTNPDQGRHLAYKFATICIVDPDVPFTFDCVVLEDGSTDEFTEPLADAHRRRWGIETSYRKVGEFLPKPTSPMFSVRLFYVLFALALYNLRGGRLWLW